MKMEIPMKKISAVLLLVLAIPLIAGCPYVSRYPLSDPAGAKIDPVLPGEWLADKPEDSDAEGELRIVPFNRKEFYIELRTSEKGKEQIERYRGFVSAVNRRKLLNIQNLGQGGDYSFYKYSVEGGVLRVAYVSDEYVKMKFNSSAKLAAFFKKNMDHAGFFEKDMVFRKKHSGDKP